MALPILWYQTNLPRSISLEMSDTLKKVDTLLESSNSAQYNTKNFSSISDSNWIGSFIWFYVNKANNDNFLYDINDFENATLQYFEHNSEQSGGWQIDQDISSFYKPRVLGKDLLHNTAHTTEEYLIKKNETVRKLSVHVQLSDYNDYEGGNLELKDASGNMCVAPRTLGSVIIFDSRMMHRITPIEGGTRKSITCWIQGPRWK